MIKVKCVHPSATYIKEPHWTMNVSCMSVIKKAFHGERHERVKGEAWPPTLGVYSRLTLRPAASTGGGTAASKGLHRYKITHQHFQSVSVETVGDWK